LRRISLELLPALELPCERCGGQRWDSSTLSVRWKGKNAAELLALSVAEARRLFTHHRRLARVLVRLEDLGLGYLSLGQRGSTLSGGERQRLRLARELERSGEVPGTLYLLDEPSVGLHPADVEPLLRALRGLVAAGGTVWLVDPDPALLAACDARLWMGPGGGEEGGQVMGSEGW
jgi:excinuclease ABC subunit A